jgi:Ala-tRNA(Pro) deacylase
VPWNTGTERKPQRLIINCRWGFGVSGGRTGNPRSPAYLQEEDVIMILKELRECLDSHDVKYTIISHSPAFTAQEIAATAHISGREVAKTVIVNTEDKKVMVVLPASHMIDFRLLSEGLGTKKTILATETEFKDLFENCEVGAMPPFGSLFGMDVVVSKALAEDEEIAFNAGTHRELVMMRYADFERLVHPKILNFTVPKRTHGVIEARDFE